jgi:hypothetical protein
MAGIPISSFVLFLPFCLDANLPACLGKTKPKNQGCIDFA